MLLRWRRFIAYVCVLGLHASIHGQESASPGTSPAPAYRIQANAVSIDVQVTDARGNPVNGLRQQDFKLLEDGKPQKIDLFEEHPGASGRVFIAPALPQNVFTNAPAVQSQGVYVLLVDELNTPLEERNTLVDGIGDVLKSMPAGAQAALFRLRSKLELVQNFTSDRPLLQAALDREKHNAGTPTPASRSPQDAADDQMTAAALAASQAQNTGGAAVEQIQTSQRTDLTVRALQELARNLAAQQGRTSLLWFAGSFPVALFPEDDRGRSGRLARDPAGAVETGRLLGESNVAVYPVSVAGIVNLVASDASVRSEEVHGGDIVRADRAQSAAQNADIATMERLASETGGHAIYATNDFKTALVRALNQGDHYYTLAYTPAADPRDGKFRRIEVRVDQEHDTLAYRRGYYAEPAAGAVAKTEPDPLPAMLAQGLPPATQIVYRAKVIPLSLQPGLSAQRAGGNARLSGPLKRYRVEFQMPMSSLDLEAAPDGTRSGKVELALMAYDRLGKLVNWTGSLMSLKFSAASYAAAQENGVPLDADLDIPPAAVTLATGIYDLTAHTAGTLQVSLAQVSAPGSESAGSEPTTTQCCSAQPAPAAPGAASEARTTPQPATEPGNPVLMHRPRPEPATQGIRTGRIHLDVSVADAEGKPLIGLEPWDFKVFDNGQPRKVLSFRSFDDVAVKPNPPVQVILVIDELNLSNQQLAFVRDEVTKFMRANGGHLAQPISIMLVSDAGLRVQPRPSTDGNALADVVKGIKANISFINPAMGTEGDLERQQKSLRQIETIAENEAQRPGRKLLIWVGPGWPLLNRTNITFNERDLRSYFDAIVELSNRLREARMVVNSVSPQDTTVSGDRSHEFVFKDFLKAVTAAHQAFPGNLGLKVLATQTGGRILGPDNDVAQQIGQCIAGTNAFYEISFDPPAAEHADEYHSLKVEVVDRPGVTVRTDTGFYNELPGN